MSKITKETLHNLIESMPDDFTLEDLQYHLFILQKLEKAEDQLNNGCKKYTLEEMRQFVKNWDTEKRKNKN